MNLLFIEKAHDVIDLNSNEKIGVALIFQDTDKELEFIVVMITDSILHVTNGDFDEVSNYLLNKYTINELKSL